MRVSLCLLTTDKQTREIKSGLYRSLIDTDILNTRRRRIFLGVGLIPIFGSRPSRRETVTDQKGTGS